MSQINIAYLSSVAFSDVDLSFLNSMQKIADVTYILLLNSHCLCSCAIDVRSCAFKNGLQRAFEYEPLRKFAHLIDMDKFYVFYSPVKRGYELERFIYDYKLYKVLSGFDVVHTSMIPSALDLFMPRLRKKLVLTLHDPLPHSSETRKTIIYDRKFSFRYIKNIILLNQSQKNAFIRHYNIPTSTRVYDSSLGCYTYLQMYKNNSYDSKKPYILFFGNIVSYKGLEYLFPAMKNVHKHYPHLKLIVAGKGEFYFSIEEYKNLEYFQIENRFIPDDELADLIQNCEFTVVPYSEATQSGVIMSSYAFDKPCIATKVGGLPEMVIDGKNGLIVPPRNIEALSEAICKLYGNEKLIRDFSNNIVYEYKFGQKSWNFISKQIKKVYDEI